VKQEEALRAILAEWRRLPESERQTEGQLAAFAMKMANTYSFRYRGDKYQCVMGHLKYHISGLK
jgi:hypothetical protein